MAKIISQKGVTLQDIADEVHVSVMTASRAVNHLPGVSESLRQEILAAAERMGYKPNLSARNLRKNQSRTIGVVIQNDGSYIGSVIRETLCAEISRNDYRLLFAASDVHADDGKEAVELLLSRQIDGLILSSPGSTDPADYEFLLNEGIPVAVILREIDCDRMDIVVGDDFRGSYEITKYLIDTGSRNLLFVNFDRGEKGRSQIAKRRLAGFEKAVFERKEEYALLSNVRECATSIEAGFALGRQLMAEPEFDTIVCCCDEIAIGLESAVLASGYRIPEDVRISGFDGIRYTPYLKVPLTTLEQEAEKIAKTAVEVVLARIKDPSLPCRKIVIGPTIKLRESTERII